MRQHLWALTLLGSISMYYLYVKTHLKTGMKYLGFTERDPYIYKGSGKYWIRHIKKHGNDVWTNVIYQTEIKENIKPIGIHYTNLWNVVQSNEWANLTEEKGDGISSDYLKKCWENGVYDNRPSPSEETKKKNSESNKGRKPWNLNTKMNEDYKMAISQGIKKSEKYSKALINNAFANFGVSNGMFNKKHKKETIKILKEKALLRPRACCIKCHKPLNYSVHNGIPINNLFQHHKDC